MIRYLSGPLAICLASPLWAFSCGFETECIEAEACAKTDFLLEVLIEDQIISTEFGDLTIVAVKEREALITLFATGDGAEYLMSVTPKAARLSSQMNAGPVSVSYLGLCEGAF
ncbi:MAG: hypothetical protein P1U83_05160 [Roseovarius sp.]|nr:hypothetical protein [Roseovarius sp.]